MFHVKHSRLLVATHNAGKLAEMRQLLPGLEVVGAAELGLPEPEETADSFVGNARIKAWAACHATGLPALADDSGLEVDALGGAPGVRTADWAATDGGRDFLVAMRRTHDALVAAQAPEPWEARFVCVLFLARPDGTEDFWEGRAEGRLVWPPRGPFGHGYDPVFVPEGHDATFAEMGEDAKNRLSHRGKAARAFAADVLGAR